MKKFLINLASFALCIAVVALGAVLTYMQSNITGMVDEIVSISEQTPLFPNNSGNNDDNNQDKPGEDIGGDVVVPGDPEQGGDVVVPGDPEQGGDVVVPGDPEQGGDVVVPDDPEQGGDVVVPDNPKQGGDVVVPDNPEQGGDVVVPDDPEQGGDVDTPDEPGVEPDEPTQPENPTLSTDDARDAFGNIYDNSDPTYNDLNREFFTGMVSGFFGSNNNSEPEEPDVDEPDFDENFDGGFGEEFNPDEFNPDDETEEPEEELGDTAVENIIINVAGTYYDNLQAGIQANQQQNAGASAEEQQAARDEFVERESEAFAGLINVVTNPEETTGEQLVQSVDAIINSDVCLGTVTQSTENNPEFTETVQEATQNINQETKTEIENMLNDAIASNPEKEQQYKDLANLFGITFGQDAEIPGDVEIPEGFDPGMMG